MRMKSRWRQACAAAAAGFAPMIGVILLVIPFAVIVGLATCGLHLFDAPEEEICSREGEVAVIVWALAAIVGARAVLLAVMGVSGAALLGIPILAQIGAFGLALMRQCLQAGSDSAGLAWWIVSDVVLCILGAIFVLADRRDRATHIAIGSFLLTWLLLLGMAEQNPPFFLAMLAWTALPGAAAYWLWPRIAGNLDANASTPSRPERDPSTLNP